MASSRWCRRREKGDDHEERRCSAVTGGRKGLGVRSLEIRRDEVVRAAMGDGVGQESDEAKRE